MDVMATRNWGLAVSGAMLAAALVLAFTAPGTRAAPRNTDAPGQAHVPPTPAPAVQDGATTLVVHFRGRGPLARAERAHSARRITLELTRQRAFRGLCFANFTHGGVALRACDGAVLTGWPQRLRAMRAVARVERGE